MKRSIVINCVFFLSTEVNNTQTHTHTHAHIHAHIYTQSRGRGRSSQEGLGILTHQSSAETTIHFVSVFKIGGVGVARCRATVENVSLVVSQAPQPL